MITLEKRADAINTLNKQFPSETWGVWLADRHLHNTFVAHFGLPVAIEYKEIEDKTDDEIKLLINARVISALRDTMAEREAK